MFGLSAFTIDDDKRIPQKPIFLNSSNSWVDSVYNSLSQRERIAQLFIVAAYSNMNQDHVNKTKRLITKYNIS